MTKNPCFKCEERHQGCHASCPKYQEWHVIHANEREAIRKARTEEYEYLAYAAKRKKQMKRLQHKKDD